MERHKSQVSGQMLALRHDKTATVVDDAPVDGAVIRLQHDLDEGRRCVLFDVGQSFGNLPENRRLELTLVLDWVLRPGTMMFSCLLPIHYCAIVTIDSTSRGVSKIF